MRYIAGFVEESLKSSAVFIGGPKQVGKTTFALSLIANEADARHPAYLNWDHAPSAEKIRKTMFPAAEPLLVFDELHKFKAWKRWILGGIVAGACRQSVVHQKLERRHSGRSQDHQPLARHA